jgi:hypothetical protein
MSKSVFVSYCHEDSSIVVPFVVLLRGVTDFVFHDQTSIRAGTDWKKTIEAAIAACDLFALFWCSHAESSAEVKAEYELALALSKSIMPVLLEQTSLPASLNPYQWVDFIEFGRIEHDLELLNPSHTSVGKVPSDWSRRNREMIHRTDALIEAIRNVGLLSEDEKYLASRRLMSLLL